MKEIGRAAAITGVFLAGMAISIGIGYAASARNTQATKPTLVDPSGQKTTEEVTLLPPDRIMETILYETDGEVNITEWNKDTATSSASGKILLQGDELTTGRQASAVVKIGEGVELTMGENSRVIFSSLLKERLFVRHMSGQIKYTKSADTDTEQKYNLNIGAGRSIIELTSGRISVGASSTNVTLVSDTGDGKFGYNDNKYVSNVWTIEPGTSVRTNETTGRVTVR